jgi:Divergent InlB B-repeat domain
MIRRVLAWSTIALTAACCTAPSALALPSADASPATLSVSVGSAHGGTVTSDPPGISCPGACEMTVPAGTQIALSAPGQPGVSFRNWGGACVGTQPNCTFALNTTTSVSARFRRTPHWGVPHKAKLVTDPHELYGPLKGFKYGSWIANPESIGGATLAVTATNVTTGTLTYVIVGRCQASSPEQGHPEQCVTASSTLIPGRLASRRVFTYLTGRGTGIVSHIAGSPLEFQIVIISTDSRDAIDIMTQLNRFNR